MFAVASSRITTLLFLRIALQMQINCFSPDERFWPPFSISCKSPRGLFEMSSSSWASSMIYLIFLSEILFSGSILNLRVPVNRVGSWGITVMHERRYAKSTDRIFTPSMKIWPSSISTILPIARQIVLFPAPVRPTTPIFSPGYISKDKLLSTISVVGLYRKTTFWKTTLPSVGQFGFAA